MKFLHLGDLHLGKMLGEFDLIEDQRYILDQILHIADEKDVDAVLVAGDVFDKSIPREAAVNLLDYFICKLKAMGICGFIISGNHDSDERLNFGSSLFEKNHIYISAIYNGILYKQVVQDAFGEVNVYMLPFVKASQVRYFFPQEDIKNYEDAVRVVLAHAEIHKDERNVLVAHQFVSGKGEEPKLSGSEGVATQSVGLVEKIGYDCFDAFDYVALGHIHSAQHIGREEVRYSGSPLKYSFSEVHSAKSVPFVTIGEKGDVNMERIPLKPMRDMRHLKGNLKKLLDRENIKDTDDFIYVTLTDEDIINDAMGIFREYYPNTVKIDYDNAHTREMEQVDISAITQDKSFEELIGDFYKLMYGCEISDEELEVMKKVAREAGVVDETVETDY